ncbi:MAG: serine/threonine protein kinase [Gemmataceae bacterium]
MTIVSNLALIDVLRQTHLLSPEQIDTVLQQKPGRLIDARALVRIMMQRGWLTVYQSNQLLAGRGLDLVVGNYHILDRLGQGGQSTVFKARHTETSSVVALKVIRSELLFTPEASEQFVHEMQAMFTLEHPNVVQCYDVGEFGDTFYCALEYVEGTDLGKYVRLAGALPTVEACEYIRQTALGLQHAHERNLIHRDIKPVNLYLTGEAVLPTKAQATNSTLRVGSTVKILDWGLASLRPPNPDADLSDSHTNTKALIGTADYLSPEQAMNPDTVDIRGDIYSLGCTFYYLLTGDPPFPNGTAMKKILRHQKEDPVPIDEIRPDLPLGMAPIIRRMMAKKPEDRYQTPAAVAMALKPFCRADRFLLPRLNREARHRLGLDEDSSIINMPLPSGNLQDELSSHSTFSPHAHHDTRHAGSDTTPRGQRLR